MEIVVGVASGDRSDAAVKWAALEAQRCDLPLVLLHAYSVPAVPSVGGPLRTPQMREEARAMADHVLARARRTAESVLPKPHDVTCEALRGTAGDLLAARAPRAHLLVVGGHEGRLPGHRVGVTVKACLHASGCPVVVVPRPPAASAEPVTVQSGDARLHAHNALAAGDQGPCGEGTVLPSVRG